MPFLRPLLLTTGTLVVLNLSFHMEENWRGRRSWEAWKASQEAAGQSYASPFLLGGEIRDADNFASASVLEEGRNNREHWHDLFWALPQPRDGDWAQGVATDFSALESRSQDLIQGLKPFGEVLDRMTEAAYRPSCRFPEGLQHYSFLATMARVLHLRAEVRVRARLYQGALEDIVTLLRISRHLQREPGLLPVIGRMVAGTALQPLWEGLQAHAWTPQQLAQLQEALVSMDLPGGLRADQGRRWYLAQAAQELDAHPWTLIGWTEWGPPGFWRRCLFSLLPKGWAYQFLGASDRAQTQVLAAVDVSGRRIVPLRVRDLPRTPPPYGWVAWVRGDGAWPTLKNLRTATWVQASLDQARVACALECFRLTRGVYPGALNEMVPKYLAQVPNDWLTGAPLTYTAKDAGYRLGATGWTDPDEPDSEDTAKAWTWVSGK